MCGIFTYLHSNALNSADKVCKIEVRPTKTMVIIMPYLFFISSISD